MSTAKTGKRRPPTYHKAKGGFFRSLLADPKRAKDFLERAQILDKNGELAAPYRRHQHKIEFLVADRPRKKNPRKP